MLRIKKNTLKSVIIGTLLLVSTTSIIACSEIDTKNIEEKASKIADFKLEDLKINTDSIKNLTSKINFSKFGDFKIDLVNDNGQQGVKLNFNNLKSDIENKDFKTKLAIIFATLKDVDYIEVFDGQKSTKYSKESLKQSLNINFEEITKSKDKLVDFIKKSIN